MSIHAGNGVAVVARWEGTANEISFQHLGVREANVRAHSRRVLANRSPGEDAVPWAAAAAAEGVRCGLDAETARWCTRHGTGTEGLFDVLRKDRELAVRLHRAAPVCEGEIVFAAAREPPLRLEDFLRRRIPLMLVCRPDAEVVERAATLAGEILGWSSDRRREETRSAMDLWTSLAS